MDKINYYAKHFVAEIGSNHCGDRNTGLRAVEQAAMAGATDVKFQLFRADTLTADLGEQKILRPFEVPLDWLQEWATRAHGVGMGVGVTPFDLDLIEALGTLQDTRGQEAIDWFKIAATDFSYDDLLLAVVDQGKPVVLSTMLADPDQIQATVEAYDWVTLVLLSGLACYPAPEGLAPIERHFTHRAIRREHEHVRAIGLSDHSRGVHSAGEWMVQGATWFEKHFRPDLKHDFRKSPDWEIAVPPSHFACYVHCLMMGYTKATKDLFDQYGIDDRMGILEMAYTEEEELAKRAIRTNAQPRRRAA